MGYSTVCFAGRRRAPVALVGLAALVGFSAALAAWPGLGRRAEARSPSGDASLARVLVDFENERDVELRPQSATVERAPGETGQALRVVTAADAAYPGVLLAPRAGKWDVRGFEALEMDVRNLGDAAVRVLLSMNNPGADGQRHCNTESVQAAPGKTATLVLPFGNWHGQTGRHLDYANIVGLHVLLDRPGRSHRFAIDNIRAVKADPDRLAKLLADPFTRQVEPPFGRGVNLGNALEAPREGAWGVTLEESHFQAIKEAGFDSVRLPVRWSAHADARPPHTIDEKFFARVDWAIDQALRRRLHVVLNTHHYDELFARPAEHEARFVALWKQIARRYRDRPAALAFELLNEPHGELTADRWNALAAAALREVRRDNPDRLVVIGPVGFNSIRDLPSLELPENDRRLVVTVHYYSPFQFTHQGASWAGEQAKSWVGRRWPLDESETKAIGNDLDAALAWAVARRRPLYLGEFGAYEKADLESRARWTAAVARAAETRKMGWAYWEFCSGFGAYDPSQAAWREPLRRALLPR